MEKVFFSFAIIILMVGFAGCSEDSNSGAPTNSGDMPYEVTLDPADFISSDYTGNEFMPLVPGTTMIYEGEDEDGLLVRVETFTTSETKLILGITCLVVKDKAYEAGVLIEDTDDWYAQEINGNIWYMGEYSELIDDGEVVSTAGSWEAGVDGALPGLIMLAEPYAGIWYRQEYYENEAEDAAQILSLNKTETIGLGTYENCLQTNEWSLQEPSIIEHKFYTPGIGLIRTIAVEGEAGFENLIEVISQ
ncbi:MAG: hypothetical protein K9N06_00135 [Candidatus Cloacimonetes bacterium]|nr:hypothetical protein [Candidatus Cloacimonadota bacterium]